MNTTMPSPITGLRYSISISSIAGHTHFTYVLLIRFLDPSSLLAAIPTKNIDDTFSLTAAG